MTFKWKGNVPDNVVQFTISEKLFWVIYCKYNLVSYIHQCAKKECSSYKVK